MGWNTFKLKITDITTDSFVIDSELNFENEQFPISYDLTMFADSPDGENFSFFPIKNVQLPYTFKNTLATGITYDVYLQANFPPESINEFDMQYAKVKTIFSPINSLDFPIYIPGAVPTYTDTLKIYIPTQENMMFAEFSDSQAVMIPENATNGNLDGGTRKFCNRFVEDTSIAEIDGNGYVRGKKRGITKVKINKYDANDKFETFYKNIEVIQEVTGLSVSNPNITLKVGDKARINAQVLPENANNKELKFISDNPAISVTETTGEITALKTTAEGDVATIICSSLDKPLIKEYIYVKVVGSYNDIWTDIESVGQYFNASDFNILVDNVLAVYNILKEKHPTLPPLPKPTNKVSETTGFITMRTELENLFGNITFLSGYSGTELVIGKYAPNRKQLNKAITLLNEAKNS